MAVHAIAGLAPVLDMTAHQGEPDGTLPIEVGDADWVADLLATFRAGDLDAAVSGLDELLTLMREAARARRVLATVEPTLLRDGLELTAQRRASLA